MRFLFQTHFVPHFLRPPIFPFVLVRSMVGLDDFIVECRRQYIFYRISGIYFPHIPPPHYTEVHCYYLSKTVWWCPTLPWFCFGNHFQNQFLVSIFGSVPTRMDVLNPLTVGPKPPVTPHPIPCVAIATPLHPFRSESWPGSAGLERFEKCLWRSCWWVLPLKHVVPARIFLAAVFHTLSGWG